MFWLPLTTQPSPGQSDKSNSPGRNVQKDLSREASPEPHFLLLVTWNEYAIVGALEFTLWPCSRSLGPRGVCGFATAVGGSSARFCWGSRHRLRCLWATTSFPSSRTTPRGRDGGREHTPRVCLDWALQMPLDSQRMGSKGDLCTHDWNVGLIS